MDLGHRLRLLARHLPAFESPNFTFGRWVPSRTRPDGVIVMGWYEPGPDAQAFLRDVRAGGWVTPFDWPAWASSPEGQALLERPAAVTTATPEDLGRLLTVYLRAERFGDGTLAAAFDSGMLTAIMRRAAELAAEAEFRR